MKTFIAAASLATALTLAAGWFGAVHPAFDSIGHFRLHALAACAIVLVLSAIRRMWMTTGALLAVMAVSVALTWPALPGLTPTSGAPADFTVVQQNLLFSNRLPEQAEAELERTEADVLLLQEASLRSEEIVKGLADRYPHKATCQFRYFRVVAILSRHPIREVATCEKETGLVSARIRVNGRDVTLASMHTFWPWPYTQWRQVPKVEDRLRALPRPLVLAGDFNAAPWSAFVKQLAKESRTRVVPGLRFTFNFKTLQSGDTRLGGLPLDHVLHSDDLEVTRIELMPHLGSDHLGSIAGFRFRK